MGNETLLDLLMKGGFTIFILALSSIFSLKVIIEKLIQFNGIKSKYNEELLTQIAEKLEAKSLKDAVSVNDSALKDLIIPTTVPNNPMKGDTAPRVARTPRPPSSFVIS